MASPDESAVGAEGVAAAGAGGGGLSTEVLWVVTATAAGAERSEALVMLAADWSAAAGTIEGTLDIELFTEVAEEECRLVLGWAEIFSGAVVRGDDVLGWSGGTKAEAVGPRD